MFFYIKVSAKNKKVLYKFTQLLGKLKSTTCALKYFSKQKKRKFITILKSPHVNKTAQEQFEFRVYTKKFLVNSFKPFTFLLTLKKIKNVSFPGLNLEVRSLIEPTQKSKNFLKALSPDNIVLDVEQKIENVYFQKNLLKKYIQTFDCYGETFLKDISN